MAPLGDRWSLNTRGRSQHQRATESPNLVGRSVGRSTRRQTAGKERPTWAPLFIELALALSPSLSADDPHYATRWLVPGCRAIMRLVRTPHPAREAERLLLLLLPLKCLWSIAEERSGWLNTNDVTIYRPLRLKIATLVIAGKRVAIWRMQCLLLAMQTLLL